MTLGCIADYFGALHWIEDNADTIDQIPDLEATHCTCCAKFTPLDMAVIAHRRDLVEKLIARGARTDKLEFLLVHTNWKPEEVIDVCYRNSEKVPGFDIMALSIGQGDAQMLSWLIDRGGAPDSRLLSVAARHRDLECADLLLRRGALSERGILEGLFTTPDDAEAMARLLLDAGGSIDVNAPGEQGETLLWIVCSGLYPGKERAALVAMLIEHGADVNVVATENRTTPLMFVAARGDVAVMSLLLTAGADPLARDREGRIALDFARMRNQTKAIELLQVTQPGHAALADNDLNAP